MAADAASNSWPAASHSTIADTFARWFPQSPEEGLRRGPVVYRAKVLDVRTGKVLYEDGDVGMGLNYLWTRLNAEKNTIELNFDKRLVTFEYGKADE